MVGREFEAPGFFVATMAGGCGGRGFSISQVEAGVFCRLAVDRQRDWGVGRDRKVGIVLGKDFRPLAPLGVTEGGPGWHPG